MKSPWPRIAGRPWGQVEALAKATQLWQGQTSWGLFRLLPLLCSLSLVPLF